MDSTHSKPAMETQQLLVNYDRMKELKEFDESKAGVKGLLDSGITSIPRIFVHPPESLSDIVKRPDSQPLISIPVIDLAGIRSPGDRQKIVDQVKKAAKRWGFFQVINHGIPISVQNDTVSAVKAFHELPNDVKSKYYKRSDKPRGVRYTSNTDLFTTAAASWRDSVIVRELPEDEEEIPEVCRNEVVASFSRAADVAEVLLGLLSEGLGLERERLKELSFLERRVFVGHYYPYCPEPHRTVGITSHTDVNVLTIVMQNQISGLQVMHEGFWVDVKPQLGGLIVNIGDFLQVASNGEYQSVEHRVLANSCNEARISVVVFFYPAKLKENGYFGPLPELLSPEKPAIYRDFTKEELFEASGAKKLGNKSLVEKVKI